MKQIRKPFLISILLLAGCNTNLKQVNITASIFPHYDAVRAVIKDTSLSSAMIVNPGVEVHTYAPTPQQTRQIHDSDVFFYTSQSIETWAPKLNLNNTQIINVHEMLFGEDEIEHAHDEHDEHEGHEHEHGAHFWTNPTNFMYELDLVTNTLSEIYPDFAFQFESNAALYKEEIQTVADEFIGYLNTVLTREIFFVGHNAMHDFAEYFDLSITSLVDDIKPDADPTAKELVTLTNAIVESNTSVIFTEELVSLSFANTLKNELKSKHNRDIRILELHGYHNVTKEDYQHNITYVELLKRNIANIKEAIQ